MVTLLDTPIGNIYKISCVVIPDDVAMDDAPTTDKKTQPTRGINGTQSGPKEGQKYRCL